MCASALNDDDTASSIARGSTAALLRTTNLRPEIYVFTDLAQSGWRDDASGSLASRVGELNGASIYIFAKRNPDKVKNDKGEPMWTDIGHLAIPDGPGGRTPPYAVAFSHGVMKYSKNQKAVKEFLKWFHGKEMFGKWFVIEPNGKKNLTCLPKISKPVAPPADAGDAGGDAGGGDYSY